MILEELIMELAGKQTTTFIRSSYVSQKFQIIYKERFKDNISSFYTY